MAKKTPIPFFVIGPAVMESLTANDGKWDNADIQTRIRAGFAKAKPEKTFPAGPFNPVAKLTARLTARKTKQEAFEAWSKLPDGERAKLDKPDDYSKEISTLETLLTFAPQEAVAGSTTTTEAVNKMAEMLAGLVKSRAAASAEQKSA